MACFFTFVNEASENWRTWLASNSEIALLGTIRFVAKFVHDLNILLDDQKYFVDGNGKRPIQPDVLIEKY